MVITIEKISDFKSKKLEDKKLIARANLRGIISGNTTAIISAVDKYLYPICGGGKEEFFSTFLGAFNYEFAKQAKDYKSYENDRPFYKYYFEQYRPCALYSQNSDEYRKALWYRIDYDKKHSQMSYAPAEKERMKAEAEELTALLNNPKLFGERIKALGKLHDNMPQPIDLADINTLVCYIEYQNAFARYLYHNKPNQEDLAKHENVIKDYIDQFVLDTLIKIDKSGDREQQYLKNHEQLPIINNADDITKFTKTLSKDGVSSIYFPSRFKTILGHFEIDFYKGEVKRNTVDGSLKNIRLEFGKDFGKEKRQEFNLCIIETVLDECAKVNDINEPVKILVHPQRLNFEQMETQGLRYFENSNKNLAAMYANLNARYVVNKEKRLEENKKQRQRYLEEKYGYEELYPYEETNYRTLPEDGEQMLGLKRVVDKNGNVVDVFEDGLYVGNENGELYNKEKIIEIDTETDEHIVKDNPYYIEQEQDEYEMY